MRIVPQPCVRCGEMIPTERLAAMPETRVCVACSDEMREQAEVPRPERSKGVRQTKQQARREAQRQRRAKQMRTAIIWGPIALGLVLAILGLSWYGLRTLYKINSEAVAVLVFSTCCVASIILSIRINKAFGFQSFVAVERFTGIRIGGQKVTEEGTDIRFGCVVGVVCLGCGVGLAVVILALLQ